MSTMATKAGLVVASPHFTVPAGSPECAYVRTTEAAMAFTRQDNATHLLLDVGPAPLFDPMEVLEAFATGLPRTQVVLLSPQSHEGYFILDEAESRFGRHLAGAIAYPTATEGLPPALVQTASTSSLSPWDSALGWKPGSTSLDSMLCRSKPTRRVLIAVTAGIYHWSAIATAFEVNNPRKTLSEIHSRLRKHGAPLGDKPDLVGIAHWAGRIDAALRSYFPRNISRFQRSDETEKRVIARLAA